MTAETKSIIESWLHDNRMFGQDGYPGSVYEPDNLSSVGIDGNVDIAQLADLVESGERERCAKIAEGNWMPHSNALGSEYILRHRLAEKIRSGNA